jgi:hypothetical protein
MATIPTFDFQQSFYCKDGVNQRKIIEIPGEVPKFLIKRDSENSLIWAQQAG